MTDVERLVEEMAEAMMKKKSGEWTASQIELYTNLLNVYKKEAGIMLRIVLKSIERGEVATGSSDNSYAILKPEFKEFLEK